MKISLIKSVAIFTISAFGLLHAQSMLGYQYPTGIPLISSAGPSLSLGRTGVGIQNEFLSMSKNPANLGILRSSMFSSVISYDFTSIKTGGSTSTQPAFNPQLFSFAFPLKNSLGSIAFSLEHKSSSDLFFFTQDSITLNGSGYQTKIGVKRKGGTTCWQLGYGYSIKKIGQIGLSYERSYFNEKTISYKQISGLVSSTQNDSTDFHVTQNGIRGGILLPLKKVTLGLSGEYFFINEGKNKRDINTDSASGSTKTADFKLPPAISLGGSYKFSPEWLLAADLGLTLWDEFYSGFKNYNSLQNAINASAGFQYIPAPTLLSPRYYETINYRAGVRFAQMPISNSYEGALSLGLGLPLQQKSCLIDISFEYGRRYNTDFNDYREDFFSLQLGLSGSRKWYQTTGTASSY